MLPLSSSVRHQSKTPRQEPINFKHYNHTMKTRIKTSQALWGGLLSALLIVSSIFNIVPFPLVGGKDEGYGRPCYSPNGEYYIERYTTLPKALFITPSYSKSGTAVLYDKAGKELYRGHASDVYKPGWFGDRVIFFGGWGDAGYEGAKLPSSPGDERVGCF